LLINRYSQRRYSFITGILRKTFDLASKYIKELYNDIWCVIYDLSEKLNVFLMVCDEK